MRPKVGGRILRVIQILSKILALAIQAAELYTKLFH